MAAKKTTDGISAAIEPKVDKSGETTVTVFIPLLEDVASDVAVDQTVNVTINGKVTQIRRGEYVDVKVPVFLQLRNQFPRL
jgi:hypothetical protein